MKYIDSTNSITVFHKGKGHTMRKDHPLFAEFSKAVEDGDEASVNTMIENGFSGFQNAKVAIAAANTTGGGFVVSADGITWNGVALHGTLVEKIRSLVRKGAKNLDNYVRFLENLYQNPSMDSVKELFDFLQAKELPITEDGCFLAYKGVRPDGWSQTGNTKTVVLRGKTDASGRIWNGIGEVIEVARNMVDPDRRVTCSHGLHVGSYAYAKGFGSKLFVVKVNPKDVVSVPHDCGCQKARVSLYEVVADAGEEITASAAVVVNNKVESKDAVVADAKDIKERIVAYVRKKNGATIKQIQSALSGVANLSSSEIEKLVLSYGYDISYGKSLSASFVD
jgi:hypothetical protein